LWNGRTILVPLSSITNTISKKEPEENNHRDEIDQEEEDPENIGFLKLDVWRLRVSKNKVVSLAKVEMKNETAGVLLITPSAVMFDPTIANSPDDGLILPMSEVKRAALYHINNNTSHSWLQVSGGPERVAYFGIEATETSPILRCLKKWSPAKSIATPALTNKSQNTSNTEENSADLALVENSLDMSVNEEFFSSIETEWQIESGNFKEEWTKLDLADIEPKLEKQFEMPEISHDSSTFKDDQIMMVNNLLPARCIGAKWNLKYSTRKHGTSIKTLYRQVFETDGPNLCVIKTCCGATIGGLSSHPLRTSDHFFGSGESFLFRFPDSNTTSGFKQFNWSGSNSFFVRCDKDQLIFGSSEGNYAIWIEGSLLRGTSKPTKTFNNPTLTKNKDFKIETVEVWTFD